MKERQEQSSKENAQESTAQPTTETRTMTVRAAASGVVHLFTGTREELMKPLPSLFGDLP